jgi:tetratricopeptide (TPR) repeat protein
VNIFISHASEQTDIAEGIEVALSGEGHAVFLDRSDLPSGETYNDQIRKAVAQCDLFIFLISPEAVAKGRYTITELEFAKQKWSRLSNHVLPVVVKATELGDVPAYLKGVTLLEPQGNIPAAVAAAVAALSKPWWRLTRTWAAALLVILVGAGLASWWGLQRLASAREVSRLLEEGRLQHQSERYPAAWELYAHAASLAPGNDTVARARERLAMDWLDNIVVTEGKSTFTAIVEQLDPVLVQCAESKEARRAADCLAHIGWGDFLRIRDGIGGLNPVQHYRHALEREPDNVYAHAMWAFDVLRSDGSLDLARSHFDKALASGRERAYVRGLEIAGLLWHDEADGENEVVRVANDMRLKGETLPGDETDRSERWRLWNVYYDRLLYGHGLESFLSALPGGDHLATFRWLPEGDIPRDKRNPYLFMRGHLEERAGRRAEALATFRDLRDVLSREGTLASGGPLPERTVAAVKRLSK